MTYGPEMASGYDRGRGLRREDLDRWMDAAAPFLPPPAGRVLDVGAGTGRFAGVLGRCGGATVVAVEPSAAMRAAFRTNWPGVPVVGAAAEALPFRAGVFDAVWASQVVHHVGDLAAFAAGLRRVLRPGGHVLIRGGFGPVEELLLYRYFPDAWAAGTAVRLSLDRITGVLGEAGIVPVDHVRVDQVSAETSDELAGKVRSLSHLAALPDPAVRDGLLALRRDAAEGRIAFPVTDRLDLVVFRSETAPSAG